MIFNKKELKLIIGSLKTAKIYLERFTFSGYNSHQREIDEITLLIDRIEEEFARL